MTGFSWVTAHRTSPSASPTAKIERDQVEHQVRVDEHDRHRAEQADDVPLRGHPCRLEERRSEGGGPST